MSDSYDSFRNILQNDPKALGRWQQVTAELAARIEAEYGVSGIDPDALLAVPSARLFAVASEPLSERWKGEAEKLAPVAKVIRDREMARAYEEARAAEADAGGDRPSWQQAIKNLNEARALGKAAPPKERKALSASEEGKALARVLSQPTPAMKIAAARREGLA